jgi:hypothetical protein
MTADSSMSPAFAAAIAVSPRLPEFSPWWTEFFSKSEEFSLSWLYLC